MAKTGLVGKPDDSDVVGVVRGETLGDLAELAVRLGSPVSPFRSGNVLFFDDFSQGLGDFEEDLSGAQADIYLVNSPCLSAGIACRLVAGSSLNNDCILLRNYQSPQLVGVGWEVNWSKQETVLQLTFELDYYDGTNRNHYYLYYDFTNTKLQVWDNTLGVTDLVDDPVTSSSNTVFNSMKMIVDLENMVYNRLYWNGVKHLMTSYTPHISASATPPLLIAKVGVWSQSSDTPGVVIDNLILTQNEEITTC